MLLRFLRLVLPRCPSLRFALLKADLGQPLAVDVKERWPTDMHDVATLRSKPRLIFWAG